MAIALTADDPQDFFVEYEILTPTEDPDEALAEHIEDATAEVASSLGYTPASNKLAMSWLLISEGPAPGGLHILHYGVLVWDREETNTPDVWSIDSRGVVN